MNELKNYQLKKDMDRNYLMVIDSSIYEKVKSRESFDSLEERKGLHSLKSTKRRDMTLINQISY